MQILPSQIMVLLDSSVAECRGEWAVMLPHAPPHGKPAPLLADEVRSALTIYNFLFLFCVTVVRPLPVRMDVGGRNEAARRRQSIALEKQRTYSTVENHINHVKHHKDREGSSKCENDVITEEHAGGIQVDIEGQQRGRRDVEDNASQSCCQADQQSLTSEHA
jgi:hypothetical protein